MKTNSTYKIGHISKGIIRQNLTFSEVRRFAFNKRSSQGFSPIADVDYYVVDEKTEERFPMQHIPN